MSDFLNAVLISLIAGASTGIGSIVALFKKKLKPDTMGLLLGFSAGIMLLVAFVDLLPEANLVMSELSNPLLLLACFFTIGVVVMMAIDLKIPHIESATCDAPPARHRRRRGHGHNPDLNQQELINRAVVQTVGSGSTLLAQTQVEQRPIGLSVENHDSLLRLGPLLFIGITIHNLPEGLVVGASYAFQPGFGIFIALAILIHNIPEGIAVSTALIASNHRTNAQVFGLTLLSGLTEPLGAILGAGMVFGLGPIFGNVIIGFSLAFAAGIMVYVTTDELIPTAHMECQNKHRMGVGLLLGMMFILFLNALIA